ncbi:MAG: aminotransferase class IV family protein [Flavipsychrobacter sp.]|nr:aminotransferase class IV family protein [Flavipsychrobacter sp.]
MNYACINGEFCTTDNAMIGIQDMALQRGYGMFDFFKVMGGKPIFLDDHLDRFWESARLLRLPLSVSRETLTKHIHQLIEMNQWSEAGIRMTLTAGYAPDGYSIHEPNFLMSGQPVQLPETISEKGLRLFSYAHQRQLPLIKSIDYLMAVWIQQEVKNSGADEVLYHQGGWITECPRANIFLVTADGVLVTPGEQVLKGITRKKILEVAEKIVKIETRPVHLDEFKAAREAFITSTTKLITPIAAVDGIAVGTGGPGEISRVLFDEYYKLLPI